MPFVSSVRGSYGVQSRRPRQTGRIGTGSTGGTITTAGGYRIHTFTAGRGGDTPTGTYPVAGSANLGGGGGGGYGGASEWGRTGVGGANGGSGNVLLQFDPRDVRISYTAGIASDSTVGYIRTVWIQSSGMVTILGG